jgi:hypothetical protein
MHVCESSTPTAASTVCASAGQQRPNLEGARITPRPQVAACRGGSMVVSHPHEGSRGLA